MNKISFLRKLKLKLLRREETPDVFLERGKGVIRVGANTGQERMIYEARQLNVFWVEPIPNVYEILCQNIRDLPRQRAAQALLLDQDGVKVTLNIANNEGASSSVMSLKKHQELWPGVTYVDALELTSSTLATLIDQYQVNIGDYDSLVLDTQGSELLILKGSIPLLSKINYILIEAPDFEAYEGCPRLEDFNLFMKQHGFRLVAKRAIAASSKDYAYYDVLYRNRFNK